MNWNLRIYSDDEISEKVKKTGSKDLLFVIDYAKKRYVDLYRILSENPNEFNIIETNMKSLYRISRSEAVRRGIDVSKIPPVLKIENFIREKAK